VELPIEIKQHLEEMSSTFRISELISAYKKISNIYLEEKNDNSRIAVTPIDIMSYALTRMPATYGSASFGLEELKEYVSTIDNVIDIGSGTGSASIATSLLFNCPNIISIEREKEMMSLSKELCRDINPNIIYINDDFIGVDIEKFKNIDLIVESYFLNELDDFCRRNSIYKILDISPKFILLVEPGTMKSFHMMKEIRSYILTNNYKVLGPCPHQEKCNYDNPNWCHFVSRISRSKLTKLIKGGDAPYEDEKFTYLLLVRNDIDIENKYDFSRVLRHPYITKGRIELEVCTSSGNIEKRNITKSNKELFKIARKVSIGDKVK